MVDGYPAVQPLLVSWFLYAWLALCLAVPLCWLSRVHLLLLGADRCGTSGSVASGCRARVSLAVTECRARPLDAVRGSAWLWLLPGCLLQLRTLRDVLYSASRVASNMWRSVGSLEALSRHALGCFKY